MPRLGEELHRLTIECAGGVPLGSAAVCLDGVPVKGLTALTLYMEADSVNTVTIELRPGEVHVDEQAIVELQAYLDLQKQRKALEAASGS